MHCESLTCTWSAFDLPAHSALLRRLSALVRQRIGSNVDTLLSTHVRTSTSLVHFLADLVESLKMPGMLGTTPIPASPIGTPKTPSTISAQ